MNMQLQTLFELIQCSLAYMVCFLLLPYLVLNRQLKEKSLTDKFLSCLILGNIYIINIVFLIFLLHIPGRITLILAAILPAFFIWKKLNHPRILQTLLFLYKSFFKLLTGEAKIRTIFRLVFHRPKKVLLRTIKKSIQHIRCHFLEWCFLLALSAFNIWYYSYQTFHTYSYGTNDLVVHHSWINQMLQGNIFCDGIYPFGFHNVLYFLGSIFGIPLVSLFRVFSVMQMLLIYLSLYFLTKKLCRSRFMPYLGMLIFTLPNLFNFQSTMRYQWTLPQEYGMIFLYPCAYYLIQFFDRKRAELVKEKELTKKRKLYTWLALYQIHPSTKSLVFFAISFSLTLTAHFYITIIAFFLCAAIAIAYFPTVFYYRYFFPILTAGLISLFISVAPMGAFYLQGTQLQGSLYWALSAMSDGNDSTQAADSEEDDDNETHSDSDTGKKTPSLPSQAVLQDKGNAKNTNELSLTEKCRQAVTGLYHRIANRAVAYTNKLKNANRTLISSLDKEYNSHTFSTAITYATELFLVLSFFAILLWRRPAARNFFAVTLYLFLMILLFSAEDLHIPAVMDHARACIFLAYATPLFLTCLAEAVYLIIAKPMHYRFYTELLPIGLCALVVFLTIQNNYIKKLNIVYSIQQPGEMRCNYEIMKKYPEKDWTIVTTTDTLQVIYFKGWHYELNTFLGKMAPIKRETVETIPTKYVFFYIEKKPIVLESFSFLNHPIANSGLVSKMHARKRADYKTTAPYTADNRLILESKFYYWAKAFQNLYPQEFTVFYEDDSFICYRLKQNPEHLYNFAIDYGYNN